MADDAATADVQTEKVLDIASGKMVDKPIEAPPVIEEPKKEPAPPPPAPTAEAPKTDTPPPAPPKTDTPPPALPVVDFNATLKEKFALDEEGLTTVLAQNKTLQEELQAAKSAPKEPVFASEQDKAAYDFIKQYPPSRLGEGMKQYATILDMDPLKADEKTVLRETFIMSKPTLSRESATKLFEADFKRRYQLDKDKFESDADYQEAQELANIEKEEKVATGRQTLSSKLAELKKTPEIKPETPRQEPKAPEISKQYASAIDGVKLDKLSFTDPTDAKIQYHIPVPADKLKEAQEFARSYVNRVDMYDANGKIPNFDQSKLVKLGLMMLFPEWYEQEQIKQVTNLARTITAEQIAGTKPDKESKGLGEQGAKDVTTQFRDAGLKAKQEREEAQNRPRY